MLDAADLPDDVAALKALLIAAQAREAAKDVAIASKDEHIARKDERIERLEKLVAAFKQAAFGRKSEKTDPDQFDLALEDLETAMAVIHAEDEGDTPAGNRIAKPRATNRGSLPKHLPRVEEVIEPESLICACGGCLHCIGEDVSERLDVIPAQFRIDQNRRNCRGEPSRRSGTASIIRINPRLAAGLDIDPRIQKSRMPEIPCPASAAPDGVSLPLTSRPDVFAFIRLRCAGRWCGGKNGRSGSGAGSL